MLHYHPIMGIAVFVLSIVTAYIIGRKIVSHKGGKNNFTQKYIVANFIKKSPPKGDISSPDAPWLNNKKKNL